VTGSRPPCPSIHELTRPRRKPVFRPRGRSFLGEADNEKPRLKPRNDVTVACGPSEEEFGLLAGEGLRSVVILRLPGEEDQPLSPEKEGAAVFDAANMGAQEGLSGEEDLEKIQRAG
jgi:hypothetical protein